MLTFIEGGFYSAAHKKVSEEILKNVTEGKRTLLIVPEQNTVISEIEMTDFLPPSAPLFFEVTNFTRLSNSAFRALGGIRLDYATKEKKALIMWQTLGELMPFLSMTAGRREITPGTVERAMSAAKEAYTLGLSPEDLERLSGEEGVSQRLKEKLSDLAKITSLYKSKLRERYSDTEDDISLLIKKLEEYPEYLCDTEIFIEGFTSFTAAQYSLLSVLTDRCNITVSLTVSTEEQNAFEYSEVMKTRRRIAALCDTRGKDKRIVRVTQTDGEISPLLRKIMPALWKSNYQIDNSSLQSTNLSDLRIFEAKNPFEECEFIASDILSKVKDGASYRDIAIVTQDASKYDGILDTALLKAGIPHFSSYKTNLFEFEAVKLIFTALKTVQGFGREDLLAYASTGLAGISLEERDELSIYLEKWKITGARFTDGVVWNMHPDGFDGKITPESEQTLLRIDRTRVKLIEPLTALAEATAGKRSVKEHALAVVNLLETLELENNLKLRAKKLSELGFSRQADENLEIYRMICAALDTVVEVSGEELVDIDAFAGQLKIVFSSSDIGRIPASFDEVVTGSADMLRLIGKKHVYLFGVNYGEFPTAPTESAYFSDKDKETLNALGIDTDTGEISGARALYSFTRAFSYAKESVTVLYSLSDASFGALIPSFVIGNIVALTGGKIKPCSISDMSAQSTAYSPVIAAQNLARYSDEEREVIKEALLSCGAMPLKDGAKIDNGSLECTGEKKDELYLTQTRIDTFVSCPLQYFCKFTLKLDEGERAEFGSSGIGSYVHAILENFFKEVKEKKIDLATLDGALKDEMVNRAAMSHLEKMRNELGMNSARMSTALSRILRAARPVVDGLCEEFATSGFTPAFFELKIDKSGKDGPTPVAIEGEGGEKIYVYGVIDRVDTMKLGSDLFVRVVDYKTGSKEFRPDDVDEGKNLQMFLYLKSIIECENEDFKKLLGADVGEEVIPAGLIYVKTDIKDKRVPTPSDAAATDSAKAAQKRMGMVLDEENIYLAMGKDYIPIKFTKSGVDKRYEKYLFSREGWNDISKRVEDVVGKIGHRISRGDIRAITGKEKQKKSPCDWCSFKAFCRNIKL